jgi:glycosyltransferase involved in cell wall biosynthesis
MLGTRLDTKGGVASVVNVYVSCGLFERNHVVYIPTHCDGNVTTKLWMLLRSMGRFWRLVAARRVGLIHVHTASRASFWRKCLFILPSFAIHIPVVLHLHGAEFDTFYDKECGKWRKRLVRFVFDKSSCVIVLSTAWKRWVQRMSCNPAVHVIFNPVLLPDRLAPWDDRKSAHVLFLGRLGRRKGAYDLLEAVAAIATMWGDLRLVMGGDGEVDRVRNYARNLGINDRVEMLGWVAGIDRERCLREACVYALPSYAEGLPMSVLEAMASGLPIVSTRVGGIPEAVTDGVEGFLVEPGDVAAIAERLNRLLCEPDLARTMGTAARKKVESRFSAHVIVPQIEQVYGTLESGHGLEAKA